MSDNSKIEWTDATWNPVTGCTKVSEGCRNCYASTFSERFRGVAGHYFENGFDLTLRPDKVNQPLKWTRPRKIFVNSMSDLFHKDIPEDFIKLCFDVMAEADWHTYQVLTKRPERMYDFSLGWPPEGDWSMNIPAHIWCGTSVESKDVLHRIDELRKVPAKVRFLSIEPLIGDLGKINLAGISWVIVGGESGRGARPIKEDWVTSIRDQCQEQGVSFFFKQWGGVNKKEFGRLLEGRTWDEMPA